MVCFEKTYLNYKIRLVWTEDVYWRLRSVIYPMRESRGRIGGPDPPPSWKITKQYCFLQVAQSFDCATCFLAIYVRINCKITKLPSQHSTLSLHRPANGVLWRAVNGTLIVVFGSSLPSSIKKKTCQSWTPSDKTLWIRACILRTFSILKKSCENGCGYLALISHLIH